MESMLLPPGFRFHPTDEELVGHYLKRKVDGLDIELEVIPVIDFCKFDPWELPDKSFLPRRDMEWFFFCPRDRKYPNGSRSNRATVSGYWKATGKDRKVNCESCVFGLRKTLVFYIGRAPGGERTDWIMHEYRLCEDLLHGSSNFLGAFALCRVVKRNGNWLKSSDQHAEFRATKKPLTSSMFDSSRKRDFDEVLNGAKESLPLDPFDKSYCSSPMNSPEAAKETSDASKASAMEEGGAPLSLAGIPTPIEAFPPYTHSPAPFEMNNTQESLLIDGHGGNCLSSFPSPAHCMGLCSSWEVITFQSLQLDSTRYVDASCNGTETFNVMVPPPPICRQASEGEEVNLWLKEDHIMTVM